MFRTVFFKLGHEYNILYYDSYLAIQTLSPDRLAQMRSATVMCNARHVTPLSRPVEMLQGNPQIKNAAWQHIIMQAQMVGTAAICADI